MNQYTIEVIGGKVVGDSDFFRTADRLLGEAWKNCRGVSI